MLHYVTSNSPFFNRIFRYNLRAIGTLLVTYLQNGCLFMLFLLQRFNHDGVIKIRS